jgi:hypothetical protein
MSTHAQPGDQVAAWRRADDRESRAAGPGAGADGPAPPSSSRSGGLFDFLAFAPWLFSSRTTVPPRTRVEVPGPRHAADGDERGHHDALGGGRQVGDVNVRRRFCHALTVPQAGTAHTRRDSARPHARLGPAAVPSSLYPERTAAALRLERSACLTPRSRALSQTRVTRVQTSVHRQGSDWRTVPIRCAIVRQYPFGGS